MQSCKSIGIILCIFATTASAADEDAKLEIPVPVPSDSAEKATSPAESIEPAEDVETPREAKLRTLFEEFGFQLDPEKPCVAEFNAVNEQPVDPVGLKITSVLTRKWNSNRTKYIFGPRTKIRSRAKLIATLQTSHCLAADIISFNVELPDGKPSTISFMRLEELQRQQRETVHVDVPFGWAGRDRPRPYVPKSR